LAGTGDVEVPLGDVGVPGVVTLPPHARGVIVLAPGTDAPVAKALVQAGLGILLLDAVAPEEPGRDMRRSADRVTGAIDWLTCDALIGDLPPSLAELPVGCFGSGSGAAAVLVAAAERPDRVVAVVACSDRPDLAGPALRSVTAPALLIVGSPDHEALRLNRQVQAELAGDSRLVEEPGTPDRVSLLARDWFLRHIG
jgi:putative phosphoribosyl transferase